MAKKNNVTRLPTRLGTTARHAAEPVQAAVRDYLAARYRLTEQLALVDALLEQGAAEPLEQQATALGERLISVHSSLIRLTTTVAIRQTAADSTVLSTALADATAPLASQRAEPQPAPASASETTSLSTIDELKALGADSVVIQSPITESGRPRPFQRGDDGQWHSHTIGRGGISSDSLWNGGGLVVVLRTDRPVTAGATPAQRIAAEAGFRGWQVRDDDHGRLRLTRGEIAIDLRYSTASGSITKATRTHADGRVDHAAAVGKLGTVLRWLKDDQ
ncbi:hypothetical protein [Nocardia wallacei]|uniref:hypothetical protein n=1 Tax=Nocardia wallacei TaxID=480035 RepID=UPI00245830C8|nr:hypothetical protein [Nocardia wallacei]